MAREQVIWCDPCTGEGKKTPGRELPAMPHLLEPGQKKPRILAMCEPHIKEHVQPIIDMWDEFGVTTDALNAGLPRQAAPKQSLEDRAAGGKRMGRTPAGGRPNQCLWCTMTYSAHSTSGFNDHLRKEHNVAGGVREAFGTTCPVCDQGPYEQLTAHGKKSHPEMEIVGISQLFIWARDNDDPFGIYAERVAAVNELATTQA